MCPLGFPICACFPVVCSMLSPAAPLANADEMFHTRRQFVVTVTVTGWNLGAGDVVIGISVSGNSPNLVKAHEWARSHGVKGIALVGAKRGRMAEIAEQVVVVGDTHYGRVEDVQMHILHLLCYAFMENAAPACP